MFQKAHKMDTVSCEQLDRENECLCSLELYVPGGLLLLVNS